MCVRGPVILSLAERELKDGICWLEHSREQKKTAPVSPSPWSVF